MGMEEAADPLHPAEAAVFTGPTHIYREESRHTYIQRHINTIMPARNLSHFLTLACIYHCSHFTLHTSTNSCSFFPSFAGKTQPLTLWTK